MASHVWLSLRNLLRRSKHFFIMIKVISKLFTFKLTYLIVKLILRRFESEWNLPGANPVTRFPSRAAATTAAAAAKPISSRPWRLSIKVAATGGVMILKCSTLEAAGAAGEVVCSTVPHCAVPVTRPYIGASKPKWRIAASTGETKSIVTGSWFTTSLARVSSLEVKMLAWSAVPISGPAHCSWFQKNIVNG